MQILITGTAVENRRGFPPTKMAKNGQRVWSVGLCEESVMEFALLNSGKTINL